MSMHPVQMSFPWPQEFMQMVATEQLPESVKNAKEKVDGAIAWVTGKDTSGTHVSRHQQAACGCAAQQLQRNAGNCATLACVEQAYLLVLACAADKKSAAESTKEQASSGHNQQQGDGQSAQ
jgi:hypothetical protein